MKKVALGLSLLLPTFLSNNAFAAKRVVRLAPVDTRWIELDDGSRYGMGQNLHDQLANRLEQSGNFVVMLSDLENSHGSQAFSTPEAASSGDRLKFDFAAVPAADFSASVVDLSFEHGSRGLHRFAGNNAEFSTPFNNGDETNVNEFPARSLDFVSNWFGSTFDAIGMDPFSTISGIDFGATGEFNVVIAGMNYRRDIYNSSAKVGVKVNLLAENQEHDHEINVKGGGFLMALGATYKGVSGEFGLVRRTALKQTFDNSVTKLVAEVQNELFAIPFRTRVEIIGSEGIILNAGRREGIQVGDTFLHEANGVLTHLTVKEVFFIGSIVTADRPAADLRGYDVVTLSDGQAMASAVAASTKAQNEALSRVASPLPALPSPDNRAASAPEKPSLEVTNITLDPPVIHDTDGSIAAGFSAKSVLLPIYAFRYFQYDQSISPTIWSAERGNSAGYANSQWDLANSGAVEAFGRGLSGQGVKVGVVDTGVDYNHEDLGLAFLNRSYTGFDFMSDDARPFDDNSHGTAVAGAIAAQGMRGHPMGLAPGVQILSYKAFDPYGQTTSAAIYASFQRAIQDGVKIIVCAWDTKKESAALQAAVELAEQKGVLVVAAAGDKGEDLRVLPSYPAAYNNHANVISVTSLTQAGTLSTVSGRYSNYGPGLVDIAAPGVNMKVLSPRSGYMNRSGGSDLAAAHVAAAAALLWEKNPRARAEDVKHQLLASAKRLPTLVNQVTEGRVLDAGAATR